MRRHELAQVLHHERVLGGHGRRYTLRAMAYRGDGRRRTCSKRRPPRGRCASSSARAGSRSRRRPHAPDRRPVRDADRSARSSESLRDRRQLLVARDVPREDLGVWLELTDRQAGDAPDLRRRAGLAARAARPRGAAQARHASARGCARRSPSTPATSAAPIELGRGRSTRCCSSITAIITRSTRAGCSATARGSRSSITTTAGSVIVDGPESRDELEVWHHRQR